MAPPTKRRKMEPVVVEEISFDPSARQDYLTGFHKRKLERAKHARELAEKQARAEKLEARKQVRDERKADLQRHVAEVNALLEPANQTDISGSEDDENAVEEWGGIEEVPAVDHEAEYIDEDKYTTVTVEAMDMSKEGLQKVEGQDRQQGEDGGEGADQGSAGIESLPAKMKKRTWTKDKPKDRPERPRKKKKKFRYETKAERKFTRMKQGAKNSKEAKARRAG